MTRDEVLEHLCETVALVYHSIGDYSHPSDGFCRQCPAQADRGWSFHHSGETLRYVREAVVAKLKADGIPVNRAFDPDTGDLIK